MTRYSIYAGRFTLTDYLRRQRLYARSADAVHGLGRDVQRRLGLSGRHARLHLGLGARISHAQLEPCATPARPSPRSPTANNSTAACSATAATCSKASGATPRIKHPGAARLLAYLNHADAGSYGEALQLAAKTGTTPNINDTREVGRLKYGFGLSVDQEIAKDLGVFGRLGWNDGKTESFAFTAIDRLATEGVSVNGSRWGRPNDTVATELTVSGLSRVHADYLAAGRSGFSDRRRAAALRSGKGLGKLLQRPAARRASPPRSMCSMWSIRPTTAIAVRCGSGPCGCTWRSGRRPSLGSLDESVGSPRPAQAGRGAGCGPGGPPHLASANRRWRAAGMGCCA